MKHRIRKIYELKSKTDFWEWYLIETKIPLFGWWQVGHRKTLFCTIKEAINELEIITNVRKEDKLVIPSSEIIVETP